jgi:hypothetical protein
MARASDLTSRAAVLAAIAECDETGREAFLEKYGFGPSREFVVVHEGREYDSKALLGAAFRYQYPDAEPLTAREFSGGEETRRVLERVGFRVAPIDTFADELGDDELGDEGDSDTSAGRIPSFETLLRPTLEAVARHGRVDLPTITIAVSDAIDLDEASRALRLPNGRTVIDNRVRWALTSLAKASLVERPGPLALEITDERRRLLAAHASDIDRAFLIRTCPSFANWIADMGQLPADEPNQRGSTTVWMVRAGRQGVFASVFVERSLLIVGWGGVGDASKLSRDELGDAVAARFPDYQRNQRGQVVNTLWRLVHTMAEGDLVITPEPQSRTILLGRVAGPYTYPRGARRQRSAACTWRSLVWACPSR